MACVTVVPILSFTKLPSVVAELRCLRASATWNATYACLANQSDISDLTPYQNVTTKFQPKALESKQVISPLSSTQSLSHKLNGSQVTTIFSLVLSLR
jgi:hypothetical protein